MHKLKSLVVLSALLLFSCGGVDLDSPESVAEHWCTLQKKVKEAKDDAAKDKAKDEREAFEDEVEKAHAGDDEFLHKVSLVSKKCD